MTKIILLTLCLYIFPQFSFANKPVFNKNEAYVLNSNNPIDSLLILAESYLYSNEDGFNRAIDLSFTYLENNKNDYKRMLCYYMKAKGYITRNYSKNKTKSIVLKGLILADSIQYTYYQMSFNNLMGVVYIDNILESEQYYLKVYQYAQTIKNYEQSFTALNNLALQFLIKKDTIKAEHYFTLEKELFTTHRKHLKPFYCYHYFFNKSKFQDNVNNKSIYLDSAATFVQEPEYKILLEIIDRERIENLTRIDPSDVRIENILLGYINNPLTSLESKNSFYYRLIEYYLDIDNSSLAVEWYHKYILLFKKPPVLHTSANHNKLGYLVYKNTDSDSSLVYLEKYLKQIEEEQVSNIDSLVIHFDKKYDISVLKATLLEEEHKNYKKNSIILFILILCLIILLGVFYIYRHKIALNKNKIDLISTYLNKERILNKQREIFIENIAHEIKTPISIISGILDIIPEEADISKQNELIQLANLNAQALKNDIRFLSDYAVHNLYNENKFESNSVLNFVRGIVIENKINFQSKSLLVEFTHNIADHSYELFDHNKLKTIISNLLSNALKYSYESTQIKISLLYFDNNLHFKITNIGMELKDEDVENIFIRYYQADRNKDGQGIGLHIAHSLATEMKGNLIAQRDDDKTTSFVLTLPIYIPLLLKDKVTDIMFQIDRNSINLNEYSEQKKNLLIVDDNVSIHYFYKHIFKGYNCYFTYRADAALEILKTKEIDCIVSDIMMPEKSGFDFKRDLDRLKIKKPFIFVTANNYYNVKMEALHLGIIDYINKPFDVSEILIRIKNVMANFEFMESEDELGIISETDKTKNTEPEILSEESSSLLKRVCKNIDENLHRETFTVKELAVSVFYSESQLRRLIKSETGLTPNKLILELRLLKAENCLMKDPHSRISEIQTKVGFKSATYFSKVFKERFGKNPSEYLNEETNKKCY